MARPYRLHRSSARGIVGTVTEVPVFDHDAVLKAVSAEDAIERVRDAFVRYASGEWVMPPKVYLDAEPGNDFRAMPARGSGLAILKWVTSFTRNPERGLPVVLGMICVSSAETGEPLALVDVGAVTALRTGAVAAVAAQELAREDARTVGIGAPRRLLEGRREGENRQVAGGGMRGRHARVRRGGHRPVRPRRGGRG